MNFYYSFTKNLAEAASYKLIKRSGSNLVYSNRSVFGWLFFLVGITVMFLLLYSGYISDLSSDKAFSACLLFGGTAILFTVLGFIAGIGNSKLIINLSAKTYIKWDLSFKGIAKITGPLTDFSAFSVELKTLRVRGREHPLYIAKILSKKFKKDIVIGITKSRSRIDGLLDELTGLLGVPIIDHINQSNRNTQ